MTEEGCPVCNKLKAMCDVAGEGKFCEDLMERLKKDEITSDQFVDELSKNEKVASQLQLRKEPETVS